MAGQLFSLSAHRVQRLLDPLEIGDVLYRRCGQLDGFSGEQRVLAPPAIGLLCQLVGWLAIEGLAVWADDMNAVTHEVDPWDTEEVMAPAVGPL